MTAGPLTCNAPGSRMRCDSSDNQHFVTHSLRAEGADASEDGTGRGTPIVPIAFSHQSGGDVRMQPREDQSNCLQVDQTQAVAYQCHGSNVGPMGAMRSGNGNEAGGVPFIHARQLRNSESSNQVGIKFDGLHDALASDGPGATLHRMSVRRLTPTECERLQGFPDNWTEGLSNSARYRCLGNAVAVPVAEWIGKRIVTEGET